MVTISFQPFPVLETERLLLRAISDADTEQVYLLRSDPASMKYLGKAPLQNKEQALDLIKKIQISHQSNEGITWAITLKDEPGKLIGTGGFWKIIKEHYRAEIGYMLLPDYFNKGYMSEALLQMIDYAFNAMNLHSIEANINPNNLASEAILIKAGFVKEAYFKENFYYNGNFEDSAIYSLIKKTNDENTG
jgi:ribosomal-protein-alanine N-acetyltransferase